MYAYDAKGLLYDEIRSYHILSSWSSQVRTNGSWDTVLLVDPPLVGYVRCVPSRQLVPLRRGLMDEESMPKQYLYPEMDVLQELPEEPAEWETAYDIPRNSSIFDDTLGMLTFSDYHGLNDYNDPMTAVEIPRKLVIGIMLAFLRRRYLNLLRMQKNHIKPNQTLRNNYLSTFSKGSLSSWHDEFFNFIVGSCAAMKELMREIEENMTSMGLDAKPNSFTEDVSIKRPPTWEMDGWRSVQNMAHIVDNMTNDLATRYMQYITIQEARVSNGNAQSLSRITVLTMLFIPLSTVAEIFSMSDDFLPGRSRNWVFWVSAIPVLTMLAYLYWRQQLVDEFKTAKRKCLALIEGLGKAGES